MPVENLEMIVQDLNDTLITKYGYDEGSVQFKYQTNGWSSVIKFLGVVVYSSEDDCREWDDASDRYFLTIEDSIKEKANSLIKVLAEISFI